LVEIAEDPRSAREKLITLTLKGERFVAAMAARGEVFLHDIVQHLSADVTRGGIEYFQQLTAVFNRSRAVKGKPGTKR